MDKNNPIQDTLWTRCFFELYAVQTNRGSNIELSKVDELVIEKSKMPLDELIKSL